MDHKRIVIRLTHWITTGFIILFLSSDFNAFGQENIGGVINTVSARIDEVYGLNDSDIDSLRVNSTSGFASGDTVLIHMTVGADFITIPGSTEGKMAAQRNSGKYAIFILDSLDAPSNLLFLNSTLGGFDKLSAGEYGQVIKIPTYRSAKVTSTLTCLPYDTATKTGGILALMVKQGLELESDIDVDGKGFPGAAPDDFDYTGTCASLDPTNYSKAYFTSSESVYSASKGQGVANTFNDITRGNGAIINGGGGGNGRFSGGGGGANGGLGGSGGNEYSDCAAVSGMGGKGGRPLELYYGADNRISLGGGGGTSSQMLAGFGASAGGNGGGIVIIVCDSLIGNGNIYARGDSVSELSTYGAGGGGGGGTIILHVNTVPAPNKPKLWVNGGHGGSIDNSVVKPGGPGGGGGSGVIWHNRTTLTGPEFYLARGKAGSSNLGTRGATDGGFKPRLGDLKIPIRGFLFNYIPDADTICFGSPPQTINAAPPAGGTGVFVYKWMQSADAVNWVDAAGTIDQAAYTPPPGTNVTTFYKRTVYNAPALYDTSNVVEMFVMPVISNNSIVGDATVCTNLDAGTLSPNLVISGGNNSYRYKWEKSSDAAFTSADSVYAAASYPTLPFTNTTWYRRIAMSGPAKTACVSNSNSIKITVLPLITNNNLSPDQEICTARTPSQLTGNPPAGGAGPLSYTYKWEQKNTASTVWSAAVTSENYQPPLALSNSMNYRRIVISGPNETCKDTSAKLTVAVMPDISNNILNPIAQNILCSGLPGDTLSATTTASSPALSGGNGTYAFRWQVNNTDAAGGTVATGFIPGILTSTSNFRRIVSSGTNPVLSQRCYDTTDVRTITILEEITNNLISIPETTWCEGDEPDDVTGNIPENGSGSYLYTWQSMTSENSWANTGETAISLNTPVIASSVDYRRIVESGLKATCKDTSNIISLTMQKSIENNRINNNDTVWVCFDSDTTLQAGVLTGGDETSYSYLWKESPTSDGTYEDASQSAEKSNPKYLTEAIQTVRYYKRLVTSGVCESTSLPVRVEPLDLPELSSLTADLDSICSNKNYPFITISVESGALPYTVSFSDGQIFTFETGSKAIQPLIGKPDLDPGFIEYHFKVLSIIDSKACRATNNKLNESLPLTVFVAPEPRLISASDTLIESCSNSLLVSVDKSFGVPSWHLWNANGITASQLKNPDITLTALYSPDKDFASVSLAYVEDIANCPSDTLFIDAILYNNPDTIRNLYKFANSQESAIGDTLIVFISDNQNLKADEVVTGVPAWSISSGAGELSSTTGITTAISKLDQDDPTFLTYSISNGTCPVSLRTVKIVRKELLVYDGFSPNEDGVNDELWAVGLADEEVDFKFQLFSSSGNFIREIVRKDLPEVDLLNNQVVIWDGTTSLGGAGNYVPDGTYYYVLIVDYRGQSFDKKGYIVVKR